MDRFKREEVNVALSGVKNRDENALLSLYNLIGHTIRYIAFKYMKNTADAEDLEQDFWADIYKIADKFLYFTNGFGYLCKVMTNMSINSYRKLYGKGKIDIEYVDYELVDPCATDDDFEGVDNRITIRKAINKLDDIEKIVIQLTIFEDKTISQIGKELGISKSRVGRIKLAAQNKLKKEFDCLGLGKSRNENC